MAPDSSPFQDWQELIGETDVTRTKNLFDPDSDKPFRLSRSKIELWIQCPRCFYLDRRRGIGRPGDVTYSLNLAVDILLKKEFDQSRAKGEAHPLMEKAGIDGVPLLHPSLDEWRDAMRGIRHLHEPTNFLVFGAIDDAWVDSEGKLIVVDYKATSTDRDISIDGSGRAGYRRQMDVYRWLFTKNGFAVSPVGYFVFMNADRGRDAFDAKLEFTPTIIPYTGSDDWIDDALREARLCLCRSTPPAPHPECEWCGYRRAAAKSEMTP